MAPLDVAKPESPTKSAPTKSDAPDAAAFDGAVRQQRTDAPPRNEPSPRQDPPSAAPNGPGRSEQSGSPRGTSEGDVAAETARRGASAAGSTANPAPTVATGASEGVSGTIRNATDTRASIEKLNSDGDEARVQLTGEAKLSVPTPWKFNAAGKAQYGYDATVTQVGDAPQAPGDKPPQYEVTFSKNALAGIGPEAKLGSAGKFGGELNLATADRVVMRFDTKEEAARAVDALERMAAAETIRDVSAAVPGPINLPGVSGAPNNPLGNPLNGASDGGAAPGAPRPGTSEAGNGPGGAYNPNNAPEIVGEHLARQVEPSAADQQFLRDNIVAYEQQLTVQERVKLEGKLNDNLGIEGRFDANQRVIRRVELPQDGEPGRLSYAIEGGNALSTKEKLDFKETLLDPSQLGADGKPKKVGSNGISNANIRDIGDSSGRITLSWDVPASQFTGTGQPFPEADILSSGGWKHPDELSVRVSANVMVQSPLDVSRTDQVQLQAEATLRNPDEHAGRILGGLAHGNVGDALRAVPADTTVTTRAQFVERDGTQTQHEIGIDRGGVEVKASLIANVGNDDVVSRSERSWTGAQPPAATPVDPTAPVDTAPPAGTPGQLVVVPRDGVNVRPTPGTEGERVGVLQHGTFAQPTGQTATDATGREWVEVRSTDVGDRPVQGWVASEFTAPHPEGAMDATGRTNPDLERAGYREVQVQPGDNIWDIARREGTDFQETVALNRDHVIQPDLIFPGDTIYLPGPTNPPPAPPAAEPAAPPVASPPSGGPSGSTSGGGSSGGTSGGPSGGTSSGGTSGATPGGPSGTPSGASPGASGGTGSGSSSGSTPPAAGGSGSGTAPVAPGGASSGGSSSGAPSTGAPPGGTPPTGTPPAGTPATPPNGASPDSGSDGGAAPVTGQPATTPPATAPAAANRPSLDGILRDYQVQADPGGMVDHAPAFGLLGSREMTATESGMLNGLFPPWRQKEVKDIADGARDTAAARFPDNPVPGEIPAGRANEWQGNDGHRDAMRHALGSAMLARDFGPEWATRFTTAHEGLPEVDQNADREAMDLYNNAVGIRIAQANPGASNEVLAQKIEEAIGRGELVVVTRGGDLAWSDQVPVGGHGLANDPGVPGVRTVPDGAS